MDGHYDHLKNMEPMNRALFRAGHIYILLFGLINSALGTHFKILKSPVQRKIQVLSSLLIFVANFLVIYSFFTELPTESIDRPLAANAIYLLFGGVAIHGIVTLISTVKREK